jgi:hypothetical protein
LFFYAVVAVAVRSHVWILLPSTLAVRPPLPLHWCPRLDPDHLATFSPRLRHQENTCAPFPSNARNTLKDTTDDFTITDGVAASSRTLAGHASQRRIPRGIRLTLKTAKTSPTQRLDHSTARRHKSGAEPTASSLRRSGRWRCLRLVGGGIAALSCQASEMNADRRMRSGISN